MFLRLIAVTAAVTAFWLAISARGADAQAGWVIESFDVDYSIDPSGVVLVAEDIRVDFQGEYRHGIFREMPVRYEYDDEHDRLISVGDVQVDDGVNAHPFELITNGTNLQIKIGDPNVFVTGKQRYVIHYVLLNSLNASPLDENGVPQDWDEFYWNVTGNDWETTIQSASATVRLAGPAIERATCFQGPTGSTEPCEFDEQSDQASFRASRAMPPGSGLTVVTAIEKGAVAVGPPLLVEEEKTEFEQFVDFFELSPYTIVPALALGAVIVFGLARLWWSEGRDRWYGDMYHLSDGSDRNDGVRKPMLARETIVVEYEPPDVERRGRRLRPAEIGVLVDENADTLDVSATLVDLAVRRHIRITEERSGGIFGLFQKEDYTLEKLHEDESDLLPYEAKLKNGLFDGKQTVKVSELKNKFHKDLERIKKAMYRQAVNDKLFPRNPDAIRLTYRIGGFVIAAIGVGVLVGLGFAFGGGLIGIPLILGGFLLVLLAPMFPRRTARGRQLMRRSLGFRKFMTTAETERQRFAEKQNIFHEYLPYAMVFGCVDKWAKAFEDLGLVPEEPYYYTGVRPFRPRAFTETVSSFSTAVSGTMASTPGSSGGSGFSGGGSSGGGGGGGGGGSW
jgi:uncharacterized membrane protein YgcG